MVLVALACLTQQWTQIADYDPNNLVKDLRIEKVTANYVPFHHNEAKPDECLAARITFTFTIANRGQKPVRLPKFVSYELNNPQPWKRPSEPLDLIANPELDVVFGENLQLRPEDRKTLKPGETTQVTSWRTPPGGPWHPMKLEARFAEQLGADLVWVGPREPHRATLSVDAPDYQAKNTVTKPVDGKPEKESNLFSIAAFFACSGKAVGGPVEMSIKVPREGRDTAAMTAGQSYDDDSALSFLKENVAPRARPDFDRIFATIKVGCPKHKFQRTLIDANPSNDTRVLKRGSA